MCKIQLTAIPTGDVWVTLNASIDGTNMSYPATGTDAAITIPNAGQFAGEVQGQQHLGTDLFLVGKVSLPTTLTATGTVVCNLGSIAQVYSGGNQLPIQWAPCFTNVQIATLGTTAGNHVIWYSGMSFTSI